MEPHEVNRAAVGGNAKAVRLALKRLGMRRCSLQLVYRQCRPSALRLDWYALFLRWFLAIFLSNRAGAELLYEDFCSRVRSWRESEGLAAGCLNEQIARCNDEHNDIIRARFLSGDTARLKREIAEDIAEKRLLLAMIQAREAEAARAA